MIPPPNYTQVPNILLDNLFSFTMPETSVLMVICRQTFGWQRDMAQLSLSFIEKATGLTRECVISAINSLLQNKIVSRQSSGRSFSYRLLFAESEEDQSAKPTSQPNRLVSQTDCAQQRSVSQTDYQIVSQTDTKKETNKETKKKEKGGELPDLPARLKTAETERAWKEWKQHRREKKQALTPLTASKNLNALEEWGPDRWVKAIDYTIGKGWSGMFEPPAPVLSSNSPYDPFANCRPAERVIAGKF